MMKSTLCAGPIETVLISCLPDLMIVSLNYGIEETWLTAEDLLVFSLDIKKVSLMSQVKEMDFISPLMEKINC
jgi:hypothetical protein